VRRIPLSVLVLLTLGRSFLFFLRRLGCLACGHMLDRMGRSPFFDGWKSCPRCRADLDIAEARATCPECGLVVYANPGPTVSGLVLDDDGRILLARRAADPGRGLWDILGGFADEGESPLETLVRELREETGVEIEPLEFYGAWPDRYGDGGVWTLNLYWTARIAAGEPEAADDVAEVRWFAPEEIPPWDEFAFENTVAVLKAWKAGL
jgi:ADP-ribose pyrophosphatase YjhB (NUDIX family)